MMQVQAAWDSHAARETESIGSTIGGSRAAWLEYHVPASETEAGKERERAYYEALGRFIQMFAEVERIVALTFWAYAQTKPEIAKIVFSGVHLDHVRGFIKQLAEATKASDDAQADLEYVLAQLSDIEKARNGILHHGASEIAEGRGLVSNAWKAKAEPTEFPISADDLVHMEADLRKIVAHLNYRHLGTSPPTGGHEMNTLDQTLWRAWQYRHPVQQKSQNPKVESPPTHKRGPKQPRQPRS